MLSNLQKATPGTSLSRDESGLRAVEDPMHVWKLLAQELGYPTFGLTRSCR